MSRETARKEIEKLVERFDEHYHSYQDTRYDEAKTRLDFINKFFKALGWDVDNEAGRSEAFRDVVVEFKTKIKGRTKSPDYLFRYAESRKLFYVEAKKPSVKIKTDAEAAFQLRRYGRSTQLAISILTNFEEFAIYDCTRKPAESESATAARIYYITYKDYLKEFDFLYDTFSLEGITHGKFDAYIKSDTKKKGRVPIDKEFLESLNKWRQLLATTIVRKNVTLNEEEVKFAVQQTLDRLIFLRFCEDRFIEPYGQLLECLHEGNYYEQLFEVFKKADKRYNSGLFKKEKITPSLNVEDKIIRDIIKDLYYPRSDYEFSVMPVEIIGNAYEQFLGKVIRITPGHLARIEDKPEVRKAGGVYYTPQYIVEYIVKNTVGELAMNKTPQQIEKIKIVDPACGSGSFLLGAYDFLLKWHQNYWHDELTKLKQGIANGISRNKGAIIQKAMAKIPLHSDGRLTTQVKKQILLNHIFGVDIDKNAVEVTKLSLLLKCMEGETEASVNQTLNLNDRVLPDLDANIKCGNSLIGPDYYDLKGSLIKDESDEENIRPFDWKEEFPLVFKNGGFDAVIGNPPYVRIQILNDSSASSVQYFKIKFKSAIQGNYDLYLLFVEKGIDILNTQGKLGFILPNKFFNTDYGRGLRKVISDGGHLDKVVDFKHHQIFEGATTYCCLLFLNQKGSHEFRYRTAESDSNSLAKESLRKIKQSAYSENVWNFSGDDEQNLIKKLNEQSKDLISLPCEISRGSSTGNDNIFILRKNSRGEYVNGFDEIVDVEKKIFKRPIFATDFSRFHFNEQSDYFLIFPYSIKGEESHLIEEKELQVNFPLTYNYLSRNKKKLLDRKQFQKWYSYSAPRSLTLHTRANILIPLLADHGLFAVLPANRGQYQLMASGGFSLTILNEAIDEKFLVGLLNSKLLFWMLSQHSNIFRGGWITCTKQYFANLPIKKLNSKSKVEKRIHDSTIAYVTQLFTLHQQLHEVKPQSKQGDLQRHITYAEKKVDELVFELYGLTTEEIELIENATNK